MALLRLNKNALEQREDLAYFQERLFDGIAYTLTGDTVTALEAYHQGRCSGPYRDPQFEGAENSPRVLMSSLTPFEEDYEEPYSYQGKRFNGLAYQFEGNYCVGLLFMKEGQAFKTLEWLGDGTLVYYIHNRRLYQEYATCYPDGRLEHLKLDMTDHFSLELKLSEDQALKTLILTGDFFARAQQVANQYHFFPLASEDTLSTWRAAPRLFLSGDAINDSVFQKLQSQSGFQALKQLCLFKTGITAAEIEQLECYTGLNELEIVEKTSALKEAAKRLQAKCPRLKVEYEGK